MCNLQALKEQMCQSGIGKVRSPIMLLRIIAQLLCNQSGNCGTPTTTLQVSSGGGSQDGTYSRISGTLWEQVTPSPDFGIRLVSGTWEVFELLTPGPAWYTIPQSQFPCGTWTTVPGVGVGTLTASYI